MASGVFHWAAYSFVAFGSAPPVWTASTFLHALWFVLGFLGPIAAHEAGHVWACRRHGMAFSGPFPIPFPFALTGTLGAFIRLRSPYPTRQAMVEVGAAGPLAGVVAAMLAAIVGCRWSVRLLNVGRVHRFGTPVFMAWLLPNHSTLHPLATGAWLGFVLTFVNLLPFEHLDGGAIVRGLWPKLAAPISVVTFTLTAWMTLTGWATWGWALLIQMLVFLFSGPADDAVESWPVKRTAWLWASGAAVAMALSWTLRP